MMHKRDRSRRIALVLPLSILIVMLALVSTALAQTDKVSTGLAQNDKDFIIGVDDILQIQVWDNKDLDQVLPVRPDGKISFPLVGDVQAAGLTVNQLTDILSERLSKTIKSPSVSIMVKEIRSYRVFFVGQVVRPGVYPIKPGTPLLQALTLAGGTTANADPSATYVVRGGKRIPVDLRRLVQRGEVSLNIPLQTDDTVVVPEIVSGANPLSVFIMGEVAKPGSYAVGTEPLTVMKLISLAGGFTPFAAPSRITLIREGSVDGAAGGTKGKEKTRLRVNADAIRKDPKANPDVVLEPGDVVIVP